MNRKIVICLLTGCLMCVALFADAQQPKKVARIAYLSPFDPVGESDRSEAIRQALRDLGYIEGQNIATEYRYSEGKRDQAPKLVAELVRAKVDIILVTGGTIWVQAAKNATKTIPIVMVGGGLDPVESGLIESLARPGGNVTGLSNLVTELGGKRLELLKEGVPKLSHVAILHGPATRSNEFELKEVLPGVAHALRLAIQPWEVRDTSEFDRVFATIGQQRPDGLYVLQGPLMTVNVKRISDFALKNRLPSMWGNTRGSVDVGGLMSYNADPADAYRRLATYVDKILKGAKPADLPVEQPMKLNW